MSNRDCVPSPAATVHSQAGDMLPFIRFEYDFDTWPILTYCPLKYQF